MSLLLPTISVNAAIITNTWIGASSGTNTWEVNTNWSWGVYPNQAYDAYIAVIGDTSNNRTIETTGAITISRLTLTQTNVSGTNTLKLGGNLTVADNYGVTSDNDWKNTTGDATRLVIDLAGHNLTFVSTTGSAYLTDNTSYTLKNSGVGGVFQINQWYNQGSGNITIEDGVTVKTVEGNTQSVYYTTWAKTATFQYAANTTIQYQLLANYGSSAHAMGNLMVGDATNTVASSVNLVNAQYGAYYVQGNVDLLTYTGGGGASARMTIGSGAAGAKLYVGGNFTDQGTDSWSYGDGTIIFNGGIATEHTLSTGRAGLTTSFQVGQTGSTAGNIALGKDLATTGNFTVLKTSKLNVDVFMLNAGNVDLQSTVSDLPTIAFTFGQSAAGLIDASGQLSLSLATINVTYDASGWTDGDDLTLFNFGTLNGTPNLTVNTFGSFTYDAVVVGGNSIYLDNVQIIPEPGSAALVLVAAAAGLLLYRRKKLGY